MSELRVCLCKLDLWQFPYLMVCITYYINNVIQILNFWATNQTKGQQSFIKTNLNFTLKTA